MKLLTISVNWTDEMDLKSQAVVNEDELKIFEMVIRAEGSSCCSVGSNQEIKYSDFSWSTEKLTKEEADVLSKYIRNSHDFYWDIVDDFGDVFNSGYIIKEGNGEVFAGELDEKGIPLAWAEHIEDKNARYYLEELEQLEEGYKTYFFTEDCSLVSY